MMPSKNKFECCLSMDFEDFSYDLARNLGITSNIKSREHALNLTYEKFHDFLVVNYEKSHATFFCTGILAKLYPKLIEKISKDGHEIACHNFYHDNVSNEAPEKIKQNLSAARDLLEQISGQKVDGFRAPRFSIDKTNKEHLEIIGSIFKYDSSLHFSHIEEFKKWNENTNYDLIEIPVAKYKFFKSKFSVKLGGSYFKLFPINLLMNSIKRTVKNGLLPIIYLHPYDVLTEPKFTLSLGELSKLPFDKRLYWFARQMQWTKIFNKQIDGKLKIISENIHHKGNISENIDFYSVKT